jgi:hypothetical protein
VGKIGTRNLEFRAFTATKLKITQFHRSTNGRQWWLPDFFEDLSAPVLRHSTNNLRNRGAKVARVGYLQPPDLTLRFSKVKFGGKKTSRRPLNSVVWQINI